jgi:hypothetical protein
MEDHMESELAASSPKRRSSIVFCFAFLIQIIEAGTNILAQAAPESPHGGKTDSVAIQATPWRGDFDGMLQRRFIRVLVAYSKTQYYAINGVQRRTNT